MPSPYTANPTATQPPSPAPAPGVLPVISIPFGTDALTIESIAQEMKVEADFIGHIQSAVRLDTPVVNQTLSPFTAVNHIGSGTGTFTPSGTAKIATGTRFIVKILTDGNSGTATFATSIDGGNTYGATQTTAVSMTDATSGATFAFTGTFTHNDLYVFRSAFTPQAQWNDSVGATRWLIDYLGFATGGPTFAVVEPLCGLKTSTTGAQSGQSWGGALGWTMNCTSNVRSQWNGTIAGGELTAVWPGGAYELQLQAARTSSDGFFLSSPMFYNATDNGSTSYILNQCSTVIEWAFAPQNTLAATDWYMGMTDSPGSGSPITTAAQLKAGLRYSPGAKGDTNMMLVTSDGSADNAVSTGIAPVASTIYRVRLEIHRSGTPFGALVRLFVNGAPTSSVSNLPIKNPIGTDMGFEFFGQSTGTGVRSGLEIGYFKRFTLPLGSMTANI